MLKNRVHKPESPKNNHTDSFYKNESYFDKRLFAIQKSTRPLFNLIVWQKIDEKLRLKYKWYYSWRIDPIYLYSDPDEQMFAIQKSTRTSIKKLQPLHNYCRQKSTRYYKWHIRPESHKIHWAALAVYTVAVVTGVTLGIIGGIPKPTQAAQNSVATSTSTQATTNSAQRKTFFDTVNFRHWAFYYTGSAIGYSYSTDGNSWTSSSTVAYDTTNYSITYKAISGTGYVYLATECNTYDICLKRGTLSNNSITWGSEITVMDGTGAGDKYNKPTIAIDNSASNYVWISSIKENSTTLTSRYQPNIRRSTNAGNGDLSAWQTQITVGRSSDNIKDLVLMPQSGSNMALMRNGDSQSIVSYTYNGSAWSEASASGDYSWFNFPSEYPNSAISALSIVGSDVYIGGQFTNLGITGRNYIARWDGAAWNTVGNPGDINASVTTIAISDTDLYVGGTFTNVAGVTGRNYIARWNMSNNTWNTVGNTSDISAAVSVIKVKDSSNIYVGGAFVNVAGATGRNRIARWDGAAWNTIGNLSDINSTVNTIAFSGTDIYVGGVFTNVAGVTGRNYITRWDGAAWNTVGAISNLNSTVQSIAVKDASNIYVGGSFTNVAGVTGRSYLARWDGAAWNTES